MAIMLLWEFFVQKEEEVMYEVKRMEMNQIKRLSSHHRSAMNASLTIREVKFHYETACYLRQCYSTYCLYGDCERCHLTQDRNNIARQIVRAANARGDER